MPFSIVLILIALALYSVAIWSEKVKKVLEPWMIYVFGTGFVCDLIGTTLMLVQAEKFQWDVHTICGCAALLIMALHFVWAMYALVKQGKYQKLFSRFSIYAWGVWLLALITGSPITKLLK